MTEGQLSAFNEAAAEFTVEAVQRSCEQYRTGKVQRDNRFAPNAVEFVLNTRAWEMALSTVAETRGEIERQRLVSYPIGTLPKPPLEPLGPIKLEIGGMMTDVSQWTFEEKTEAMATGKVPESRKVAGVPLKLKRF